MSQSKLDAWQVCLVVTALVVIAEAGVNYLLKRDINVILHNRVRTGALGVLVVITVIAFVVALGPSLADQLSSVAAAVSAVVALWLTYRSYQSTPRSALSGTGEPEEDDADATVVDGDAVHDIDLQPTETRPSGGHDAG